MSGEKRSPSAARLGGDDFQHIVAWRMAMRLLVPGSVARSITVEALDAGSMDDVVVRNRVPPHEYVQAKYSVDGRDPISSDWLLAPRAKTSVLQRCYQSWCDLREAGAVPKLRLITTKERDPNDPLLRILDPTTETLTPWVENLETDSDAAHLAQRWREHLAVDHQTLVEFLRGLRLSTGRPVAAEVEHAKDIMQSNGLRADDGAIAIGLSCVRGWVKGGRQRLTARELEQEVERADLRIAPAAAVISIAAIDADKRAADATLALDWRRWFPGDDPSARRAASDPAAWRNVMQPELFAAADRLREARHQRVRVQGYMRLATWFTAGVALGHVRGFTVLCRQGDQTWTSDDDFARSAQVQTREEHLGHGDGLVIAVGVAADPAAEVLAFARSARLEANKCVVILPEDGPNRHAIPDGRSALAFVEAVRSAVRARLADGHHGRIHLFLACPAGLALLLGHGWNRLAPTVVYEDLGAQGGYIETFSISA